MNESQHDRELERYLQRGDPLSRAYDFLREDMPSAALDRAVLERARAELASKKHVPRWSAYTAIAATIVLSFAIVLRVGFDTEQRVPVQAQKPGSVPDTSARERVPTPVPYEIPLQTAPASPAIVYEGPPPDTIEKGYLPEAAAERDAQLGASDGAPARQEERADVGALTRQRGSPVSVGGGTKAKNQLHAQPIALAPAPAAPALSKLEQAEQKRSVAPQGTTLGAPQSAELAADPPPEAWLQRIAELRAAGRNEEADREMKRFLEAYPGYFDKGAAEPTR